jgi:hypothetical protein
MLPDVEEREEDLGDVGSASGGGAAVSNVTGSGCAPLGEVVVGDRSWCDDDGIGGGEVGTASSMAGRMAGWNLSASRITAAILSMNGWVACTKSVQALDDSLT